MKKILYYIKGGSHDNFANSKVRKTALVNILTSIGFVFMFIFAINEWLVQKYTLSILLFLASLFAIGTFLYQLKTKNYIAAGYFVNSVIYVLFLYLLIGGMGTDKIYWLFVLPPLAFFILGRKVGLIWVCSFILLTGYFLYNPIEGMSHYPADARSRFLGSYIVLTFFIYAFEYALGRSQEHILNQSDRLALANIELAKLSLVASKTDNAVIITDGNGVFEWVNESFTRLFGYTLDDLIEKKGNNLIGQRTPDIARQRIINCIEQKQTVHYELPITAKNGKKIWVHVTLTPITNEHGAIVKLIAIDSDITRMKEYEQEILQKNEEISSQRDELQIQKHQIETQNDLIKGSIRYAQTIQKAILPLSKTMEEIFDCFVMYKPKDIVSGDLYWFANYTNDQTGIHHTFAAIIDCTGHGVPGAFMSLIANRLINDIVMQKDIVSPANILELMDKGIKQSLNQTETDNNDGMDVCLCRFDYNGQQIKSLVYAGAKLPLYYIHPSSGKVEHLEADRRSLGGARKKEIKMPFTDKTLELTSGCLLYLSSDGYIDQSNPERKRLGTPKLIEILTSINQRTMNEQLVLLEEALKEHQQTDAQRDDITVLGLKIR